MGGTDDGGCWVGGDGGGRETSGGALEDTMAGSDGAGWEAFSCTCKSLISHPRNSK